MFHQNKTAMMIWSTFNTCLLDNVLPIYEVNDNNYNYSNNNDNDNNDIIIY